MSSLTSSLLRLSFSATFILTLTLAGYLWSQPYSRFTSILLAMTGMVFVAAYVALTWRRENEARRFHQVIEDDNAQIANFKESVHLLAGVVEILRKDSEDLRQGHLVGEIRLDAHPGPALSAPSPLKAIDDATEALLALPPPDQQVPPTRENTISD